MAPPFSAGPEPEARPLVRVRFSSVRLPPLFTVNMRCFTAGALVSGRWLFASSISVFGFPLLPFIVMLLVTSIAPLLPASLVACILPLTQKMSPSSAAASVRSRAYFQSVTAFCFIAYHFFRTILKALFYSPRRKLIHSIRNGR